MTFLSHFYSSPWCFPLACCCFYPCLNIPLGRAGRGGPPAAVAPAGPKCRPGFPCPGSEYNPDSATVSSTKREIRCVGANCKKAGVSVRINHICSPLKYHGCISESMKFTSFEYFFELFFLFPNELHGLTHFAPIKLSSSRAVTTT